jgi:hypothetical protein
MAIARTSEMDEPDDTECIHGLIPETCSICRHPYQPPAPDRAVFTMAAKFDGICVGCRERIEAGDLIVHLLPSDRWVCLECAVRSPLDI